MTTNEIADRLVALCRAGQWKTAQQELFAADAVSIEPYATPEFSQETRGKDAIEEKGRKFESLVEAMHGLAVSEPLVAGDSFACTMTMDVTMKGQPRMLMTELCVYAVKEGKVVSEQFFM